MIKVDKYLNDLKIKRVHIGGLDETAVYKALEKVCDLYEDELIVRQRNSREQIALIENSLKKRIRAIEEQTKYLEKENEIYRRENERLAAIVSPCMNIKEELSQQAEKEAEKIRKQAEKEADHICIQAEKEAGEIREQAKKDSEKICADSRKEKQELLAEVDTLKKAKNNILQSLNVIQRFCISTQKEIQTVYERETDKS